MQSESCQHLSYNGTDQQLSYHANSHTLPSIRAPEVRNAQCNVGKAHENGIQPPYDGRLHDLQMCWYQIECNRTKILEHRIQELEANQHAQGSALQRSEQVCKDLFAEKMQLSVTIDCLHEEKHRLELELDGCKKNMKSLREKSYLHLNSEKTRLESANSRLAKEISRLEGEKSQLKTASMRLEKEISRLEGEKSQLKTASMRLEEENSKFQDSLRSQTFDAQTLHELTQKLKSSEEEMSQARRLREQLSSELQALQTKHALSEQTHGLKTDQLHAQNKQVSSELEALHKKHALSEEARRLEIDELRARYQKLSDQWNAQKVSYGILDESCKSEQELNKQLRSELEAQRIAYSVDEELQRQDMKALKDRVTQLSSELDEKEIKGMSQADEYSKEIQKMQNKMQRDVKKLTSQFTSQLKKEKDKTSEKQKQLEVMKQELAAYKQSKSQLEQLPTSQRGKGKAVMEKRLPSGAHSDAKYEKQAPDPEQDSSSNKRKRQKVSASAQNKKNHHSEAGLSLGERDKGGYATNQKSGKGSKHCREDLPPEEEEGGCTVQAGLPCGNERYA